MTDVVGERATGLLGLAAFACIVAGALIAPPLWEAPPTTATAVQIAAYVDAERDRSLVAMLVYSLAMGLFLCFAAGLAVRLRRLERSPGPWPVVFACGAVALATLVLAAFAPGGVNAYRAQDPALAQALYDMTFAMLAISGVPTAVCLAAYAAVALRRGGLPAWTGWLALLGVVAHLAIAASLLADGGFLSLQGDIVIWAPATFFAWILLTSLALLPGPARFSR